MNNKVKSLEDVKAALEMALEYVNMAAEQEEVEPKAKRIPGFLAQRIFWEDVKHILSSQRTDEQLAVEYGCSASRINQIRSGHCLPKRRRGGERLEGTAESVQ